MQSSRMFFLFFLFLLQNILHLRACLKLFAVKGERDCPLVTHYCTALFNICIYLFIQYLVFFIISSSSADKTAKICTNQWQPLQLHINSPRHVFRLFSAGVTLACGWTPSCTAAPLTSAPHSATTRSPAGKTSTSTAWRSGPSTSDPRPLHLHPLPASKKNQNTATPPFSRVRCTPLFWGKRSLHASKPHKAYSVRGKLWLLLQETVVPQPVLRTADEFHAWLEKALEGLGRCFCRWITGRVRGPCEWICSTPHRPTNPRIFREERVLGCRRPRWGLSPGEQVGSFQWCWAFICWKCKDWFTLYVLECPVFCPGKVWEVNSFVMTLWKGRELDRKLDGSCPLFYKITFCCRKYRSQRLKYQLFTNEMLHLPWRPTCSFERFFPPPPPRLLPNRLRMLHRPLHFLYSCIAIFLSRPKQVLKPGNICNDQKAF